MPRSTPALALLVAGALGCGSTSPPREAMPATSEPAAPAALVTPPLVVKELPLPGPAPRPPIEPVAGIGLPTDAGCARCHEEIAAEWAGSLHHRAWQNVYFARSYATEPQPFCRKCHAPGADPAAEPPPAAREAGVGCTTCHVVSAGVVGVRAQPGREGAHVVLGDARLATAEACGACHDFPFPGPGRGTGPMQDTLGEHRRSAASATTCQSCHMPEATSRAGGTHRHHGFRVQGDRAMLAQAVELKGAVLVKGELRLSLAPGAIGHAFPTGDVFRRVEVRALPIDAAGRPLGPPSIEILGRSFGPAPGGPAGVQRAQRSDSRLQGPRTLVLRIPEPARRARWQIVWQRLPPALAQRLGMEMSEHETVVLEGVVSR